MDYNNLLKEVKENLKSVCENAKSDETKNLCEVVSSLVEVIEKQDQELADLRNRLSVNLVYESKFDSYQLDLLEYIYTNVTVNELKLNEFYKKDQKYRVAFTRLKDTYIYKGYGGIYSNAANYQIMPDKEKYIVEELEKAGKI
ncbi:MAG: hypothetical protein JXL85_05890 [Bacilli bacterium]|nr:hypothetical protein [Bacilli bacterium]